MFLCVHYKSQSWKIFFVCKDEPLLNKFLLMCCILRYLTCSFLLKTDHFVVVYDLPCTEDIPTCGDTCGKLMSCGLHTCVQRCHQGPCGSVSWHSSITLSIFTLICLKTVITMHIYWHWLTLLFQCYRNVMCWEFQFHGQVTLALL